jgi:hypothetical protein
VVVPSDHKFEGNYICSPPFSGIAVLAVIVKTIEDVRLTNFGLKVIEQD